MKKNLLTRMWLFLLTMIMVLSLVGCGAEDDDDDRKSKKNKNKTEASDDEDDEDDEDEDKEDEDKEDEEPKATPEPTATPVPNLLSDADKATFDLILSAIYEVSQMNYDLSVVIENCYASEEEITAGVEDIGEFAYNSLARLQELQQSVDNYSFESKEEEILLTHAVAKKYFKETIETYQNLYNIGETHTAALAALDKVTNNYEAAETEMEVIEILYEEYGDMVDAFEAIKYPAYMELPIESMIDSYVNCLCAFEELYIGYYLDDPLRQASAYNTLDVLLVRAVDSAYQFDDDVQLLCVSMYNRLNDRIYNMAVEVEDAVTCMSANQTIAGFTYLDEELEPEFLCDYIDTIFPALYNSVEYVVCLSAICEQGDCDVLIEAEIEGFSQKYSQKITLGNEITKVYIKPAILSQGVNLNSQKTTQLKISVTNLENNKIVLQETKQLTLMSLYDLRLEGESDEANPLVNTLAWVTPEADEIRELKRIAVEDISILTEGYTYNGKSVQMNALVGYQPWNLDDFVLMEFYTKMQALAIQCAMSDMGVAYNMSTYSSSDFEKTLQRVVPPSETISSKSGVCIETALVMASALQSAGMHCMLLFPPGHCQVAVEIWDTGEYLLLETTILPVTSENLDYVVTYLTKDEWREFVEEANYIIDCNMAPYLNLTPVYY